jgi:hypothetical protein
MGAQIMCTHNILSIAHHRFPVELYFGGKTTAVWKLCSSIFVFRKYRTFAQFFSPNT